MSGKPEPYGWATGASSVYTAGERDATQVLIDRGCRRIGTIAGPGDMTAAEDGGQRAAEVLMAAHPDLDGLVVASDLMASGALKVLAASGRRVPDDVAVVGYDDLGVAERTTPALTTVRQPVEEMTERATRLLLEQIDGRSAGRPMRVIIPPTLVRRDSA